MKSERAEAYINANEMDAAYLVDKDGCGWAVIGIHQARKAVELAEQEAEIAKLKICLDESKQREEIARKVIDDKNREIEKLRRL